MTGTIVRDSGLVVPDVLGHGTLELINDRTGRVEHRETFENFVSAETKKYMKWMARRTMWTGIYGTKDIQSNRAAGDPNIGFYGSGGGYVSDANGVTGTQIGAMYRDMGVNVFGHADVEPRFCMTHCAVWSDTTAEDSANEYRGRGTIIGWANKRTYSGVDTKRGTVNLVECSCDPTKTRWAFDWPTTAANGTFQSVGWQALVEGTNFAWPQWHVAARFNAPAFGAAGTPYLGASYSSLAYAADFDAGNDRILTVSYDGGGANLTRVWPVSWAGVYGPSALFTIPGGNSNLGLGGLAVAGSSVYLAIPDRTTNPCLRLVNLSGSITASLASTWTAVLGLSGSQQVCSIAYDGTNLWVAAGLNVVTTTVWKINPTTGAVLQTIDVSAVLSNAVTVAVDSGGDVWVGSSSGFVARYSAAGVFKGEFAGGDTQINQQRDLFWRDSGGVNALYTSVYQGPQQISQTAMRSLGARTLLGSPVTKANTQTMKVVYEFDFS